MTGVITDMFWMGKPAVHLKMEINDQTCIKFYAKNKEDDAFEFTIDDEVEIVYTMNINNFRDEENLQLFVKQIELV